MSDADERWAMIQRAEELLEHRFSDKALIEAAITHPSAVMDHSGGANYERLEFLGDSLLGAIVARRAFDAYPKANEGKLTRLKMALVSGSTLSELAYQLGLADVIVLGSSELGTGGRGVHSALENVYEAIVAALFLDGGPEVAEAFVDRTLIPLMNEGLMKRCASPKSLLQERLQTRGLKPSYHLVGQEGPPHDRDFFAEVRVGQKVLGRGQGRSKKEAESEAATEALQRISEAGDEASQEIETPCT